MTTAATARKPESKSRIPFLKPSRPTFFDLLGNELRIGCQLHLEYDECEKEGTPQARLFNGYAEKGFAYRNPRNRAAQVFEFGTVASEAEKAVFTHDWHASVLFPGRNRGIANYVKLVFFRSFEKGTGLPRVWMCCARMSEGHSFGFSVEEERNSNFMHLAYPGISGAFEPVFLKARKPDSDMFVCYRMTAEDAAEQDILVRIEAVPQRDIPHALAVTSPTP